MPFARPFISTFNSFTPDTKLSNSSLARSPLIEKNLTFIETGFTQLTVTVETLEAGYEWSRKGHLYGTALL